MGEMAEFMDRLSRIKRRLSEQDNRSTESPIFLLQEKCYYLTTSDYVEEIAWVDTEGHLYHEEPDKEEVEDYEEVYVGHYWQTKECFFTEQAAKDHQKSRGYAYNKTRIYAESLYKNPEMKFIREFLMR